MAITKWGAYKPIDPAKVESIEVLAKRYEAWVHEYNYQSEQMELAYARHKDEIEKAIQAKRAELMNVAFGCECHRNLHTAQELHDLLVYYENKLNAIEDMLN